MDLKRWKKPKKKLKPSQKPKRKRKLFTKTQIFRDITAHIISLERAEVAAKKEAMRVCDWSDPEDYVVWKRLNNRQRREKTLNRLVPDRKCPRCEKLQMGSRSWVINKRRSKAMCRSCYFRYIFNDKGTRREDKDAVYVDVRMFEKTIRYKIDGVKLRFARKHLGMTQAEFGKLIGWAHQYQGFLECGTRKSVNEEKMNLIMSVFERMIKEEEDDEVYELIKGIVKEIEERYIVHHIPFKQVRKMTGASATEFAKRAGYEAELVHGLESGKAKTISKRRFLDIITSLYKRYRIRTQDFTISSGEIV